MEVCQCEQVQDVYSISVVSDKGNINTPCPSQLAFLSFLQGPYTSKSYECLDVHNGRNCIDLQIGGDKDSSCGVDIDIGKYLETQKTDEQTVGSQTKTEDALTRVLLRKISLQMGGKIMQYLLDHSLMLMKCSFREKSTSDKRSDTGTIDNRWRRYNRSTSFNSRKIVLLSSILSSIGTMLLIYLTLRVKHNIDGLVYAAD
eukprot:TRINITY_DN7087_c0_g4_i3.p1 TRINITY_DN7087_c0_g4~~TRINITY_DN7087_c0_g4_i3.p1  ORF type:complete len:201 (-),score=15.75 TRINITY_DN7087_c0_g4_i3:205-807(-)